MFLQAHVNYHRDEMTSYGPKAMSYLYRYTAISPLVVWIPPPPLSVSSLPITVIGVLLLMYNV